jgi:multicomponent Na+:H+ antiporter subunit G
MSFAVEIASWTLIALGAFFTMVGGIGLLRMPDLYTRMHAVSVIDSLGIGLTLLGLALQSGLSLVTLKLLFLLGLVFFTWPVVTHALAQASLHAGIEPKLAEDRRDRLRQTADAADRGRAPSN